jgi:hypothetical protein
MADEYKEVWFTEIGIVERIAFSFGLEFLCGWECHFRRNGNVPFARDDHRNYYNAASFRHHKTKRILHTMW